MSEGFSLSNEKADKMHELSNTQVDNINAKIDGFKDTVLDVSESLKSVQSKVSENETKLTVVSDKVDQNENRISMPTKKK